MKLYPATQAAPLAATTGQPVVSTPMVFAVVGERGERGEPGLNGLGDLFAPAPVGVDFVAGIDAAWTI
jgi:hypothetical protein